MHPIVRARVVFAQAVLSAQPAAASTTFDGTWDVTISCADVKEGARTVKGYHFQFPAQVADGFLRGTYGIEGTPGSLKLEGPLLGDGSADLQAQGLTNNPDYTTDRSRGARATLIG